MVNEFVFAARLKAARLQKSSLLKRGGHGAYTQQRLGVEAGIPARTAGARISQYESGMHMPDISLATRLAGLLDVPPAYLFCEDADLAEMLLIAHTLAPEQRKSLREYLHVLRNVQAGLQSMK